MAGEDRGPSSKAYCCHLVNGHDMPVKWTSLCHNLVLLSALVREASFCSGRGLLQRAENKGVECSVLSGTSPRPPSLRDIAEGMKEWKIQGERIECFRNTVFWPWHDSCLLFYFIYYILLCMCMMRVGGRTCHGAHVVVRG